MSYVCRFGSPLVMQVPRDVTYMELQNDILHNMVACLRDESLSQVGKSKQFFLTIVFLRINKKYTN